MKIVICYGIGNGCSWSCDVVKCFEYESTEAFIVDFEIALKTAVERQKIAFEARSKYLASKPAHFFKNDMETPETTEWLQNQPPRDSGNFTFAGQELDIEDFYGRDPNIDDDKYYTSLPNVYELNEWFEKTKLSLI